MLAVMSAKWVGDIFTMGINEEQLVLKSIPFLEHHPPKSSFGVEVHQVMHRGAVCILDVENVAKIVDVYLCISFTHQLKILTNTNHNGFPVVSNDSVTRKRTFRGFILRKQLLILLEKKMYRAHDDSPSGMHSLPMLSKA